MVFICSGKSQWTLPYPQVDLPIWWPLWAELGFHRQGEGHCFPCARDWQHFWDRGSSSERCGAQHVSVHASYDGWTQTFHYEQIFVICELKQDAPLATRTVVLVLGPSTALDRRMMGRIPITVLFPLFHCLSLCCFIIFGWWLNCKIIFFCVGRVFLIKEVQWHELSTQVSKGNLLRLRLCSD